MTNPVPKDRPHSTLVSVPNIRAQYIRGNIALRRIAHISHTCNEAVSSMRHKLQGTKIPGGKNWTARFREKTSCHRFFSQWPNFSARLGGKICQELATLLKKSKYCLYNTITILYFYLNCSIFLQNSLECIHWTF